VKNVLIDTDVILDFFFNRAPFSDHAEQIFSLCDAGQIKGYVTPVICSNTYYLLRKVARHDKVISKMNQLLVIMEVLRMDKETVTQALHSGFKDFEDALQNFSATLSGEIGVILTRNVKDYAKSELGVMTPESYLKIKAWV